VSSVGRLQSFPASHPEAPLEPQERKFRYHKDEYLRLSEDPEEEWFYRLKVKASKIRAWGDRLEEYARQGYRFVGLCLTFKDMDAYVEFERRGGRRIFMKQFKRVCGAQIVDYVCVVEFQQRGVPHLHYLVVTDGWVEYPDQADTIYKGLGFSNVVRLRGGRSAVRYLSRYLQKMRQVSLKTYQQVVALLEQAGVKHRLRLYEFGRVDNRGLFTGLSRGWMRYLYWRVLRYVEGWRFKDGWLWLNEHIRVKADWGAYAFDDELWLVFHGFRMECSSDGTYVLEIDSLEAFEEGLKSFYGLTEPAGEPLF